jgi:3-oxoacyl-[acyl-carrier-protein] synthase-3
LQELRTGESVPGDEQDLVGSGLIDSMGWVGILSALEDATGIQNFGNPWPEGREQSIRALAEALRGASHHATSARTSETMHSADLRSPQVRLVGWGYALGSLKVDAPAIELECGLTPGTISDRAGIDSVCRADKSENEVSLGFDAAEIALNEAGVEPRKVDVLVATSATWLAFPSLAARLHARLLLRERCAALDVGGACVGVIYALAAARSLLMDEGSVALVVASEINSRRLAKAPGEFRGLFGDGACAFVLSRSEEAPTGHGNRIGNFIWGCDSTYASALRLALSETGSLDTEFKGEQLAAAAISAMERVFEGLEHQSGVSRSGVNRFALHEPNPRVVKILAERVKIPLEKVAMVSRQTGNLGSATCGVSLCKALAQCKANQAACRSPVTFAAAVGPGLLWGGTYIY